MMSLLISLFIGSMGLTSCEKEDNSGSTPINVTAVYLEDAESAVPDRLVTFGRLGQLLRIEGSGFMGMRKVYINGYSTYFNPVMVTDNSMLIKISQETPITTAVEGTRNTIRFVKDAAEYTYTFAVRDAAPTITRISNTMPAAGDTITIYGSGLVEITKITFPGNVVVTSGFESDKDGELCKVVIPAGLTEGGSILVEGANGGAYSPAYFNFKAGVILDFDGKGTQGYWSWSATGSMINNTDLESAVIGKTVKSQGNYCAHRPSRLATFPAAKNRNTEVWTAGNGVDDWRGQLASLIPTTTAVSDFAFQFDIYVPTAWANSGFLKICLVNGFNGGEWAGKCYNYVPWIVDNAVVPFSSTGWVTVTIPFSKFYAFSGTDQVFTFENVLATRETADYANFGFFFENSDIKLSNITGKSTDTTEYPSAETSINVYTDNWRVVPLTTPVYSDFPE